MKIFNLILNITLITSLCYACQKDDVNFVEESNQLNITKVAYFSFDETSGNQVAESVTKADFEIRGNGVNRMQGAAKNALFFDGLSNEITGTIATSLLPKEQFAVSLWASPRSYPIGTAALLALTEQGSSTGLMIGINKSGQLVVQYFIDGAYAQQVTIKVIPKNSWNHIMVGLNPKNQEIKIYLNNILLKSANVPSGNISWQTSNTPFSIGKNTMGENLGIYDIDYYSGALDELIIYSGQIDQETVDKVYQEYNVPSTVNYEINIDYSEDTNRPTFHAIPEFGWANESYGLLYLNNLYHMFFQKNEVFLGISKQNWGHFTSTDLVDWKEEIPVLWPSQPWDSEGAWAGSAIILNDGTPAVAYTGVDGIKAGVGTATSSDDFRTLDKNTTNPLISKAPNEVDLDFRDPFVWEDNNTYHMLVGSGISTKGGNVVHYQSNNFQNWTYTGVAYQGFRTGDTGSFWEVPIMHHFPNGKDMLLVQKTPDGTPARTFYWIGNFNNGVFTPDNATPKNLEVVNGFLSPTITTDLQGNITAIGIIPDEVKAEFQMEQGWANLFSVPQVWTLDSSNTIKITPHPNLINIRGTQTDFNNLSIDENSSNVLNGFNSRHFELTGTINLGTANELGFILGKSPDGTEQYKVSYNVTNKEWIVDASQSSKSIDVRKDIRKGNYNINAGESFEIRMFVDGSVLEIFINNEAHFTGRFYPTAANATGVDLFSKGGTATANLSIYKINN